jgi:glycosyltransferase involved in cell wall biosynthesis
MRIAVLAHTLRAAGGLSVGRNIVAALGRVAPADEYLLVLPAGVGYEDIPLPRKSEVVYYKRKGGTAGQVYYELWHLPRLVKHFEPELIFGLANYGLPRPPVPQGILFHRPQLWYEPEEQPIKRWRRNWVQRFIRWQAQRALPRTTVIFCQTETARRRFRTTFGFGGRIELLPNAVSRIVIDHDSEHVPAALAQIKMEMKLFCLTRYYSHKNLEILLDTFEEHGQRLANVAVIFTISPQEGEAAQSFLAEIERRHLGDQLINVGSLPQQALPGFFRNCDGLILPTVLESFSGTYLEAMQFGCPILTSQLDFAEEICGEAAIYFDPWNPASIADAIERLQCEPEVRATMIERGQIRAATMLRDWDSIVAESLETLKKTRG